MPRCQQNHTFHKFPKFLAKQGISGQNKEKQNYDKNTFHLPRQHLPFPNVRIRIKRHGGTAWLDRGNPIYPPAQAELKKHGIGKTAYTNFAGKRARQVTKEDYHHYDYLLCADTNNIRNTERITGADTEGKIHLLLDYADELQEGSQLQTKNKSSNSISRTISRRGKSIADPWYSGDFTQTWNDVVAGCTGFLNYLKNVHKI